MSLAAICASQKEDNTMSLIKYRAFIKVVELKSITRAAEAMGYSQSGISNMLNALEDEVGFPCLIRRRDAILPTAAGEKILRYCYQMVQSEDALRETITSINGLMEGKLRIGAYNSFILHLLPKVIAEFIRKHPNIKIYVQEIVNENIKSDLVNDRVDLAFLSDIVSEGFEFYHLFNDKWGALINVKHPLAQHDKISVEMIDGCDFIMPLPKWDDGHVFIQRQKPFTPVKKCFVTSDNAGIAMVEKNIGIFITAKLNSANLLDNVVFREFEENFERRLGMAVKSMKNASPAVKEFYRMAMEIMPCKIT